MSELYIGLLSGTSADGIDAALADFGKSYPELIATYYLPFDEKLRKQIFALCEEGSNEIHRLGIMDAYLGKEFAKAVNYLLQQQSLLPKNIKAIGSHGQNIRHHPHQPTRFTLQIGDPNIIAAETGITTIADFRRKDLAFGGVGAPLVPAFHQYLFSSSDRNRIIANIGGIANITLLPQKHPATILGFDTGPGNVLMDSWIQLHQKISHDENGAFAAKGQLIPTLLNQLLSDDYFKKPAPKSTGREYFNLAWLQTHLQTFNDFNAIDVQATLAELTAHTIVQAIRQHFSTGEILICGGGAHNSFLMSRLSELAKPHFTLDSTQKYGIDPDWIEAMAFAWLARQTLNHQPGNLPSVTGATQAAVLGGVYYT